MSEQSGNEPNRLANETSPYLLQHAYNPVDWYPWGEEAFQLAREQQRPVFLSVGYSACHWCHVMERESFEHPQIAELMNKWFINIKVDREERPDVDQIYMTAVQLVTGQGGWPMSVFMTPEGKPFFGGTYWPPVSQQGMVGFADILQKVNQYWNENRDECMAKGEELVGAIDQIQKQAQEKTALNEQLLKNAENKISAMADRVHGGFGNAPKFPHPMDLKVLLRTWKRFGNNEIREIVQHSLDQMAQGGIYDHLGGGFARYATDRAWLIPHFEKMLYDNAQLVPLYLEGFQATGEARYRRVAEETLDYVLTDMTSPEGGFYSTLDADSEGVEGKYYVWTKEEIESLLGEEADLFCRIYQVTEGGNWEGNNILNLQQTLAESAAKEKMDEEELLDRLKKNRATLLEARSQRVPPARDEKILTAWNGLMLSAFAQAGRILQDETYLQAAEKSAQFLLSTMQREDGTFWHARKDERNHINGFLDDYACVVDGLCEVYLATQDEQYLTAAVRTAETMIEKFYDESEHVFHYTPTDHEELIVRVRDCYDNAVPSGTNLAIFSLLRLSDFSLNEHFRSLALQALEVVSGVMHEQPSGMGLALIALDWHLGPVTELVACPGTQTEVWEGVQQELQQTFAPHQFLRIQSGQQTSLLEETLAGKESQNGELTVYACHRGSCQEPWVGPEQIREQMAK